MSDDLPGLDPAAVTDALVEHVEGVTPPLSFSLVAAGGSNLTYRVTDDQARRLALRRPPAGPTLPTAHDVAREFRIMAALAASAVPVPPVRWFCDDERVTGAPFYVMDFVDGTVLRTRSDTEGLTAEQAERATDSLIDTQLAFHCLDLDAVGLADLGRHDDYAGRQLRRWRSQVERADARPTPDLLALHERLVRSKPPESRPAGLAHGDYRFDNTILGADHTVAAVLDWELCTIGDPTADFAWSLQYWADPADPVTFLPDAPTTAPVFPRRAEVARRYAERAGVELDQLDWYTAFSWWKQACIVEGVYARRLLGSRGGGTTGSVEAIAAKADELTARAVELAEGVV